MKRAICLFVFVVFAASVPSAGELTPEALSVNRTPVAAPAPEGNGKEIKWVFLMPDLSELTTENIPPVSAEFPGRTNAGLKDYLTELYTHTEPIAPGSLMTRITIRKPAIFNAVRVIEKYYASEIKKNRLSPSEAVSGYNKVLEVAVAAASEESAAFEDALQQERKDALSLISVFNQVQLKEM